MELSEQAYMTGSNHDTCDRMQMGHTERDGRRHGRRGIEPDRDVLGHKGIRSQGRELVRVVAGIMANDDSAGRSVCMIVPDVLG